jgi:ribosomal protein S18 acetylase RimI-like enzyme
MAADPTQPPATSRGGGDNETVWRLEAAFDAAWPSLRQVPAGDWICKIGGGVSRRSNSANAVRSEAQLDSAAMGAIQTIYAAAGLPPLVRVLSTLPAAVDRTLAGAGWQAEGQTRTLIGPLSSNPAEADLAPAPSPQWLSALDAVNGRDTAGAVAFSAILARIAAPAMFASVRRDGGIVAGAYGVMHGGWLAIEAVATDPAHRGQGLGARVVRSLLAWGRARGAKASCLQVSADNAAGQALYRKLGFDAEAYGYHYRRAP